MVHLIMMQPPACCEIMVAVRLAGLLSLCRMNMLQPPECASDHKVDEQWFILQLYEIS